MLFDQYMSESKVDDTVERNDVDAVAGDTIDPNTQAGQEAMAKEIESNCEAAALCALPFFENGEQALKEFCNSEEVQALVEARKMPKKTFVRIGKDDDSTRRTNMACLILARENKDPLFDKLAKNRVQERKLRNQIYRRYKNKAIRIAKLSQKEHIKDMQKMKALPAISMQ